MTRAISIAGTMISIILFIITLSCKKKNDPISEPLSNAFIEGKISNAKLSEILKEYAEVSVKDDSLGNIYVEMIIEVIDGGGDSTHIDKAREKFLKANGMNFKR